MMKAPWWSWVVLSVVPCLPVPAAAQTPVGALAIDARQGDQYGWAVDFESASAARASALRECGVGCSVVLTFDRCGAYAADQDAGSTAYGWGESYASADRARERALSECSSRGGTGCGIRAWGCDGSVVEEGLGLDRSARRQIQQGLGAQGFDPGAADGLFGPRTRTAIRNWQSARGARPTGYLDGPAAAALRSARETGSPVASVPPVPPAATANLEGLFWQSIMNSTNPAEFEAYLQRFPTGTFRELAQARAAALRRPADGPSATSGREGAGAGLPASGSRASGARVSRVAPAAPGVAAAGDARLQPGTVFRDCDVCPEMVVMPGGGWAMGRYETTVGEYRAFAAATGGGADDCGLPSFPDSWRNPLFPQTDRHPVVCVSWNDAQEYLSWLSRITGVTYRLPTEEEWDRGFAGSRQECLQGERFATCPVDSGGVNGMGLFGMAGNALELTSTQDCSDPRGQGPGCRYVVRGGFAHLDSGQYRWLPDGRTFSEPDLRHAYTGFRVARMLAAP